VSNTRSMAREFAMQFLFHLQLPIFEETKNELINCDDDSKLEATLNDLKDSLTHDLDKANLNFSLSLIKGVLKNYEEISKKIEKYSKNWKVNRISKVVHTTLLLSIFELSISRETPPKVVVDEAIELGKKFSTNESNSFINGILDQIIKDEKLL
jgi:N utilization substance protein B